MRRTFASGVLFIIGTRAEIIKIQPVLTDLNARGVKPDLLWAGLHSSRSLVDLDTLTSSSRLSGFKDEDKKNILEVAVWFFRSLFEIGNVALHTRVSDTKPKIVVVHGDTLCTLLGTFFGILASVPVAHIEACVRSGSFFRPFPEEITRRLVSRAAAINFAPGQREFELAKKYSGTPINTFHNTSREALYRKLTQESSFDLGVIVVTLHRTELLSNKKMVTQTVREILNLNFEYQITWYLGDHERHALSRAGLLKEIEASRINLRPRTAHAEFIQKIATAHCVITDSGGLQNECHDLGVPVIVHRQESEYAGHEDSVWILSRWEEGSISKFIKELPHDSKNPRGKKYPEVASSIIADSIKAFINRGKKSNEQN